MHVHLYIFVIYTDDKTDHYISFIRHLIQIFHIEQRK